MLASVIMHGLVRTGRLTRFSVVVADVPGSLARLATVVGTEGGNIVEVAHQRMFSDLSAKSTVIELAVESRDQAHTERIIAALEADGLAVRRGHA